MKLNIQLFGGRGASSGGKGKNSKGMTFGKIKKGYTFQVESQYGGTYTLKVGSKMPDGSYYTEGTKDNETGTFIGSLVSNATFKKADAISKQFMIPFSRTKNWKRK